MFNSIDKASIFRLWYELAKELGYCSGQEIREGEQWKEASDRGYSLNYLKKAMRRNSDENFQTNIKKYKNIIS